MIQRTPAPDQGGQDTCYGVVSQPYIESGPVYNGNNTESFTAAVRGIAYCNFSTSISFTMQFWYQTNGVAGGVNGSSGVCTLTGGGHCETYSNPQDKYSWVPARYSRTVDCHGTYAFKDYGAMVGLFRYNHKDTPFNAEGPTTSAGLSNYCKTP